ncbi:MAG TPA: tetratricopeptide repeat protein [Burkholderiaceae bacterium]|nr:tetratricopeptide repeat protein [Burkholderiaceae bacterium]
MTSCALVFTDLVDSTLLVQRIGDADAAQMWANHDRAARDLLTRHGGREIDRTDGFFLTFDAVADAAHFAVGYQRATQALGLAARVGIHHGAVTLRHNQPADVARGAKPVEVEGLAKPFAARVMALAGGGQTLLSAPAQAALTGAGLPDGSELESHGHYRLKGVDEPVELFELGVHGASAFAPPPDAEKAYRVIRDGELWRPVRDVRHNLAAERDAFVGRAAELRALAQRFDAGARLLTVVGPGGSGKTRLVARYGRAWLGDWPGGVVFCDLSEARTPQGIHLAVALALGVPLLDDDAAAQLGHAIAARGRCLVILDNFEQVADHAAATIGNWLDRAAQASFVVTSRERLQLQGEEVFMVEPLALGDEAIELFAARARAQRPGFEIAPGERAAVAEIVRLLDGLPLAIELAAARVRVLSPAQIVARLQNRFALLAGARGAAARQATLKAAIDWSWELLAPWEQAALAQCSVFQGGFTVEAAEQVLDLSAWPDAPLAIDAVQALLDKSLLRQWSAAGTVRQDLAEPYFGMYFSIHEYAVARLDAAGPAATLSAQQRHGRHYALRGSDEALEDLSRHGGAARIQSLLAEFDNLVAACRRAVGRRDAEVALATLRAAWEVLERRGPLALGLELATQVQSLQLPGTAQAARACLIRAVAARRCGRLGEARPLIDESLALARAGADRSCEGLVLVQLGLLHAGAGESAEARVCFERAIELQHAAGQHRLEAAARGNLANQITNEGGLDAAAGMFAEVIAVLRACGDRRTEARTLCNLGILQHQRGALAEAGAHYETALALQSELGDRIGEGIMFCNLGTLHDDQGRPDAARACYEAALAIHRDCGDRPSEAVTLGNLVSHCVERGRMDEALAFQQLTLDIEREATGGRHVGRALARLGWLQYLQGQLDLAEASLRAAIESYRKTSDPRAEGTTHGELGEVLTRQGRREEARKAFEDGEALLDKVGAHLSLAKLLCHRGHHELSGGDHAAASATLARAQQTAEALGASDTSDLGQEIARLRAALA